MTVPFPIIPARPKTIGRQYDAQGSAEQIYPLLQETQDVLTKYAALATRPERQRIATLDRMIAALKYGVEVEDRTVDGVWDDNLEVFYLQGCHAQGAATINLKSPDDFTAADAQLNYDGQTGNFTVGDVLTGGTSGATGVIVSDTDAGATGTLYLRNITGTFSDNETITDETTGSATANGASVKLNFRADSGVRAQVPLLTDVGFGNTIFNPSSDNTVSTQDDACHGVFVTGGRGLNTMPNTVGNARTRILVQPGGSTQQVAGGSLLSDHRVFFGVSCDASSEVTVPDFKGLHVTGRTSNTSQYYGYNGEASTAFNVNRDGLSNQVLHYGKRNGFTTPYCPLVIAAYFYGKNISADQRRYVLWPALFWYMRGIGAY